MSRRWHLYADLQEMACHVLTDDTLIDRFVQCLGELAAEFGTKRAPQAEPSKDVAMAFFFSSLHRSLAENAVLPHEAPWPWIQAIWGDASKMNVMIERLGPEIRNTVQELAKISGISDADERAVQAQSMQKNLQPAPGLTFWHSALLLLCNRLYSAVAPASSSGAGVYFYMPGAKMQSRDERDGDQRQYDAAVCTYSPQDNSSNYKARVLGFQIELLDEKPDGSRAFENSLEVNHNKRLDIDIKISNGKDSLLLAPIAADHIFVAKKQTNSDTATRSSMSFWRRIQKNLSWHSDKRNQEDHAEPWYLWHADWKAFRVEIDITNNKISNSVEKPGITSRFFNRNTNGSLSDDKRETELIPFPTQSSQAWLGIRVLYRDLFGPRWSEYLFIPIIIRKDEEES